MDLETQTGENSIEDIVSRYRADVASLVPYLPWLEQHKSAPVAESYGGDRLSHSISFPVYDSTLLGFVKQAQRTNFLDRNYVYVYSRNHLQTVEDELKFIQNAGIQDMGDLAGILSKYVMTGMTKGSAWTEGVHSGIFYNVISKMQELLQFWGAERIGGTPIQ